MTFSLYFPNAHENECVDIKMETIYSRTTSRQGAQAWLDRHVPLGTCPSPGCPFSSRSTEPLRVSLSFQPVPGCGEDQPRSRHPAGSHLNDKHAGTAATAPPGASFQHSREPVCRPSQPERSPRDPLLPFPHLPRSVVLAPYELFRGAFCSPLTPCHCHCLCGPSLLLPCCLAGLSQTLLRDLPASKSPVAFLSILMES